MVAPASGSRLIISSNGLAAFLHVHVTRRAPAAHKESRAAKLQQWPGWIAHNPSLPVW
jgi:hypothetical protein